MNEVLDSQPAESMSDDEWFDLLREADGQVESDKIHIEALKRGMNAAPGGLMVSTFGKVARDETFRL